MVNVEISAVRRKELEMFKVENITTLANLPLKYNFEDEDVCIMGIPYDTSTTSRPGCRFGPRALRRAMRGVLNFYSQDAKWKINNIKGMDCGDCTVSLGYTLETLQLVYEATKKILDADKIPLILGGDHLMTYPELRAYAEKYGPVAMIHFDSHEDTWDYGDMIKYNHGTPFRNAIEDGYLDATHSIQIGIRGFCDLYRQHYAAEHGMKVITARQLHAMGVEECARRIREQVGDAKCIVTFDIDFLDPSAAPATGTPVPGGFTTYQAMELISQGITGLNVVGCDLVEVMENYDPGEITALAGAHIIQQMLVMLSKNKAAKEEK